MTTFHRCILVLTLGLLLLGLAAHAAPAIPLCGCMAYPEGETDATGVDTCLVCQMQAGANPVTGMPSIACSVSQAVEALSGPIPLEHAILIPHPPTLS